MLGYYLMSICDTIAMPTNGSLFVGGVAAAPMHLRGLLDRFGVVPDFLTVGTYKGAAEALTRPAPSPQANETLDGILDTAYRTLVRDLAEARKLSETDIKSRLDRGLYSVATAKQAGLIDVIAGYHDFRGQMAVDGAWKKYAWKEREVPGLGQLMRFLGMGMGRPFGDRVAVVYALGNIVDGTGEGVLGARSEIASGTLVPAIRALAADDNVKAVVLRVDSPGGSALASELIAQSLVELKAKKPVVVSMGSVAASGGYYISADATKIFALSNTLTGSIGVVGGKLALGKALARYGVKSYPRARGKNAMLFSSMQPWTAAEKKAVRDTMLRVYEVFVDRVAAGRKRTRKQILAVADGRVWTGEVAVENGLVDEIGNLDDAIAEARKLANLGDDSAIEVYPPEPTLRDFLVSFGQVQAPFELSVVRELLATLDPLEGRVLVRLLEQTLSFQDTPVQATALIPFVAH
jgi:protease-4